MVDACSWESTRDNACSVSLCLGVGLISAPNWVRCGDGHMIIRQWCRTRRSEITRIPHMCLAHMGTTHIVYIACTCRRHHIAPCIRIARQLCPAYSTVGRVGVLQITLVMHLTTQCALPISGQATYAIGRARYRRMAVIGHPCHETGKTPV